MQVVITKGPQSYQIFQQKNGCANVHIEGEIADITEEFNSEKARALVLVTYENSGSLALKPIFAKIGGGLDWQADFELKTGGPYTISVCVRSGEVGFSPMAYIKHIGVGDVFLVTGQSNGSGTCFTTRSEKVSGNVSMFGLDGKWKTASHPLHDQTGTEYSEYRLQTYYSPWLKFAEILSDTLGYPIGLIPASRGGVPISYFDETQDGRLFKNIRSIYKKSGTGLKGIIWYQGETDVGSTTYKEEFSRLCGQFEDMLGKTVPIFTVQINKQLYVPPAQTVAFHSKKWAEFREIQRQIMCENANVYMIPVLDLNVGDTIHNTYYSDVAIANRMADMVLSKLYSRVGVCESPNIYKVVAESDGSVTLYFKNVVDSITADHAHFSLLPFVMYDGEKAFNLTGYECPVNNTIKLKFSAPAKAGFKVGCSAENPLCLFPYDLITRLPIIPFEDFELSER